MTQYRNFQNAAPNIRNHYKQLYTCQTYLHATESVNKYKSTSTKFSMLQALKDLCALVVDDSDPDFSDENKFHNYQAAQKALDVFDNEQFVVMSLIHDVGKILELWGEPQWNVTGDTFVLGCCIPTFFSFSRIPPAQFGSCILFNVGQSRNRNVQTWLWTQKYTVFVRSRRVHVSNARKE